MPHAIHHSAITQTLSQLHINWVISLIIVCSAFFLHMVVKYSYQWIDRHSAETRRPILSACAFGLLKPIKFLIWYACVVILFICVYQHLPMDVRLFKLAYFVLFTEVLGVFLVAWAMIRVIANLKQHWIRIKTRTDGGYNNFSTIESITMIARLAVLIVVACLLLAIFNVSLTAFYAFAGVTAVIGAGLTYANQSLIANFFAGLSLYFDRPFSVGDWVYTADEAIQGTVEKIGFRYTLLRSFDQRPIYTPNNTFNNQSFINASRMHNRRILQYIRLRYAPMAKVKEVIDSIKKMLAQHPAIDHKCTTLVNLVNGNTNLGTLKEGCFGQSSINIQIYTFTKTVNWVKFQQTQDDVMFAIAEIIEAYGLSFAYPTTTLDLPDSISINHH